VFKSLDKVGDLVGELMFVSKIRTTPFGPFRITSTCNQIIYVIFKDGGSEWFGINELNVNSKSIRPYNADKDPDFIGAHG